MTSATTQPNRRTVQSDGWYLASGVVLEIPGAQVNYWNAVVFVSGWLLGLRIIRGYDATSVPARD